MRKLIIYLLCLLWPATAQVQLAHAQKATDATPEAQFDAAQRLQLEGRETEAFLRYLSIPGAEHAAVALARPKARKFLEVLHGQAQDVPARRAALVEGDLLLALGQKQEALAAYRRGLAAINVSDTADSGAGRTLLSLPRYPVEPSTPPSDEEQSRYRPQPSLLAPFSIGPGSHRDNWLIRRFIALEAWDDATLEFSRVWEIHRHNTQPHLVMRPVYDPQGKELKQQKYLVTPAGFDSLGLQFAIDYAYFLKRRGQADKALAVLLEPLLLMDMDDNPNSRRQEPVGEGQTLPHLELREPTLPLSAYRWGFSAGMSRKEFVRLACGEFKTLGKDNDLIAAIQAQVNAGQNRARRVLAAVRLHESKPEEALALELAYIEARGFDALTAAYRRGTVYEDFQKLVESAAQYERALALPYQPPRLPDRDEEAQLARAAMASPGRDLQQVGFHSDLLARLQRIYGALGKTDRVLDITLRQFESNPALLQNAGMLDQALRRFKAAGQEARFKAWAKERLREASEPKGRAALSWLLGDLQGTIRALAASSRSEDDFYTLNEWKDRFAKLGKPQLRTLLTALVRANPGDARSRLELLDLENRFNGPELVAALEALLQSHSVDPRRGRTRGGFDDLYVRRGAYSRTRFKSQYDLAYRLMRLYEKSGQIGKLQQLGLRLARGDKPFDKPELDQYSYSDSNDVPEHANACLALAVLYAGDASTQQELSRALDKSPWAGARAQLARRRVAGPKSTAWSAPAGLTAFGWANVPGGQHGATVLAANENVLSLCRDNHRIYAGHPWGVAIYDFKGNPVTRVALGVAALHLAVAGNGLWVGTPLGLNRIDLQTFAISSLPGDQDLDAQERARVSKGSADNRVTGLAAHGDLLWISTDRDVRAFNMRTKTLRIFSTQELGKDWRSVGGRFLFDGQYVWVDGSAGCRRYDTKSNAWQAPKSLDKNHPLRLIGMVDDRLWGDVWLNDELRSRPCIINRTTLQVTPVLIADDNRPREERAINGPFSYYGRYKGQLVFGPKWPAYVLDAGSGKLHPAANPNESRGNQSLSHLMESDIPLGLRTGTPWRRPDGAIVCHDDVTHRHKVAGAEFIAGTWTMLRLPDGTRVLGGSHSRTPDYGQPSQEWPFGEMVHQTEDGSGGLRFLFATGQSRHVSSVPRPDTLRGDTVFAAVPDTTGAGTSNQVWLCTDYGLTVVKRERVVASVTRSGGLLGNRVTSGVSLRGKMYFASRWGDNGGGLIVYDPQTAVFTSLTEADGLAANSLEKVALSGTSAQTLELTYGLQYRRWADFKYQQYSAGTYRPATGAVSPVPEPRIIARNEAGREPRGRSLGTMPYLGGLVLSRQVVNGKTWLCGTRGVVITNTKAPPAPAVQTIVARVILDPRHVQLAQAKNRRVDITSPAALADALKDPNPFYRAQALASLPGKDSLLADPLTMSLVAGQLDDPEVRLRSTALYLTSLWKNDQAAIPLLKKRLADADGIIRAFATVYLLQRGYVPELKHLREILEERDWIGSLPYGATSNIDFVDRRRLYEAVSPHATTEIFALLLAFPPRIVDYDHKAKVFPPLGASLRRHPEAVPLLLRAYDGKRGESVQRDFARDVFRFAGKPLLPVLHQALASPDRVVRSNAARACGAIGDAASIPFLIQALDLESGLSRASIVWALGELKATAALPQLVKLYVEAKNDETRRGGSGFRMAQSAAVANTQYLALNQNAAHASEIETLKSLDAVGDGWNELKASLRSEPVNPRRNEELLTPHHILEAVRKIGPAVSQEFYRTLAGASDTRARAEAAERLAEAGPNDVERNLPILRNLLSDADESVRMTAAVSLLMLGQKEAQQPILAWLDATQTWTKSAILRQLSRVDDAARLAFARSGIAAIAADTASSDETRELARSLL